MQSTTAFSPTTGVFPAALANLVPAPALQSLQQTFLTEWSELAARAQAGQLEVPRDRRFQGPAWAEQPASLALAHAYLLTARTLQSMADAVEGTVQVRERVRFAVMQWVEAMAPSNYLALNPDAQRKIVESSGEALRQGLSNLQADVLKGRISQSDESQFEVGRNLAVTPGEVVFENHLFQLIQYYPSTPTTYQRPLLVVPPCINKFYILDLQPSNSLAAFLVEQGFPVFMVSWRNPLVSDTDGIERATWDDYVEQGVLKAISVVSEISGQEQVNAMGFCVGGTLLATAAAVARARGQDPLASLTLLTSFLDFSDTGIIDIFVDENQVQMREQQMGQGGLMPARDLATTFSFLRPNELVWNYVVGNYLKGNRPPPFDLLFWNSDSTNLPGPFFAWYLRNTYLENRLAQPGAAQVCGQAIDFGKLTLPAYVYASREDHIVPWHSGLRSSRLLGGDTRFVLGASGHVAGVINPPAAGKRSHWVPGEVEADTPEAWLAAATSQPGSWWTDWAAWLAQHAGRRSRARKAVGNASYAPIEPAPGRYVKVRAV